jgi:hypothetical protein
MYVPPPSIYTIYHLRHGINDYVCIFYEYLVIVISFETEDYLATQTSVNSYQSSKELRINKVLSTDHIFFSL